MAIAEVEGNLVNPGHIQDTKGFRAWSGVGALGRMVQMDLKAKLL